MLWSLPSWRSKPTWKKTTRKQWLNKIIIQGGGYHEGNLYAAGIWSKLGASLGSLSWTLEDEREPDLPDKKQGESIPGVGNHKCQGLVAEKVSFYCGCSWGREGGRTAWVGFILSAQSLKSLSKGETVSIEKITFLLRQECLAGGKEIH